MYTGMMNLSLDTKINCSQMQTFKEAIKGRVIWKKTMMGVSAAYIVSQVSQRTPVGISAECHLCAKRSGLVLKLRVLSKQPQQRMARRVVVR